MKNRTWIFGSCILLQAVIYAFGNVITKFAYESITPFWSMSIRFGIASLIFLLFSGRHIITQLKQSKASDWLPPALCMAGSYISCGVALALTSATNVGFLISLPVVFTPFIAMFVLHRPYRMIHLPIQIAIIAGLYMLCSGGGSFSFGFGDALAVLCAILGAGAFVFGEQSLKSLDSVTVSAVQTWTGFVLSLPLSIILESDFQISRVTFSAWMVILYLAVLCTVVAFRLQNVALSKISSQTVAVILCLEPILTAVISRVLLGEVMNPMGIAGGAIILCCIIASNFISNDSLPEDVVKNPIEKSDSVEREEEAS